jgi:phosphoserine phosphatase RsbU/P
MDNNSKIKARNFKLNLLLEVTKAINENMSVTSLMDMLEDILRNKLSIGKAVLFGHQEGWKSLLHFGDNGEHQFVNVSKDLLKVRDIGTIAFGDAALKNTFEIVIPVFHKEKPLAFLLLGDIDDTRLQLSSAIKHLPFIQTLTNIIVVAMENKMLFKENLRQVAIARELELASQMQHMLFPETLPDDERVSAAAVYLPQQQVGGDYYDFIWLNENEFLICMCDVSGKGISAALLMSNFQANLHALSSINSDLTWLMQQLNKKVVQSTKGEKYITAFLARCHLPSRKLSFLNAGHHAPILLSDLGSVLLEAHAPGLGMVEGQEFPAASILDLDVNSILLCYTDGVVELENENSDFFGTERLLSLLRNHLLLRPKQLNQKIILDLESFKGKLPYSDDVAILSCRFL